MKKSLWVIGLFAGSLIGGPLSAQAQDVAASTYSETFHVAEVTQILETDPGTPDMPSSAYQILQVTFENDAGTTESLELTTSNPIQATEGGLYETGDRVVVVETTWGEETLYAIMEPYRLPQIGILGVLFAGLAIIIAGMKGARALIGLTVTIVVTIVGILPAILAGHNPFLVTLLGSMVILGSSLYIAHGFNKKTHLCMLSILLTLLLSMGLGAVAVDFARLFGAGSEEAASLVFNQLHSLDLRGLLLAALLIGTLGVLDDVTMTQTATIEELKTANPKMTESALFSSAFRVGKEHIASLINTLVIAYMGAAFPILLMLTTSGSPLWVMLNNEFMAEEIVRTLVGSATLLLAVPISTFIAARTYGKRG